jgi:pilus assembly protein CpaC
LDNGKIFLEVNPEVRGRDDGNGISTSTGFVPGFSVQRVSTRVTMEAGQTFAIGGLIQTETSSTTNKVPFLGDLPFIGAAFSSVSYEDREEELVILVTPYLVDPMDCKQAPCKVPGSETRKPDDFELFLETILEAPRGQRDVFQGRHYVPAWKNDPNTADKLPCGGGKCAGGCPSGNCGTGGCANGQCHAAQSGTVTPVTITVSSPPASR